MPDEPRSDHQAPDNPTSCDTEDDRLTLARMYLDARGPYFQRRESTRRIEWIVNAALWAGLVLGAVNCPDEVKRIIVAHCWCWWILASLVVGGAHGILWMYPMHLSQQYSQDSADLYLALALAALDGKEEGLRTEWIDKTPSRRRIRSRIPHPEDTCLYGGRWAALQAVVTWILTLFIFIYATATVEP